MTAQPDIASINRTHEMVHVRHVGEHEKASFKVPSAITLQALWDQCYEELRIKKTPRDVFQAPQRPNPVDLAPYLALTLDEAQRKGVCKDHFEIAAGTGGA